MGSEYTAYETIEDEKRNVIIVKVFHRRGRMAWTHLPGQPVSDPRCGCKVQVMRPLQKRLDSAQG